MIEMTLENVTSVVLTAKRALYASTEREILRLRCAMDGDDFVVRDRPTDQRSSTSCNGVENPSIFSAFEKRNVAAGALINRKRARDLRRSYHDSVEVQAVDSCLAVLGEVDSWWPGKLPIPGFRRDGAR